MRPRKSLVADEEDSAEEAVGPAENKALNTAMSKQAILKEVRKQKDDYRKQIK